MMWRIGILLLYTCLIATEGWGQSILPSKHYKFQVTHQVFEQIAITFGEVMPLPKLTMYAGASSKIASIVTEPEPVLMIDEKLYDICRTFGKDSLHALSLIIGHELSHYYLKHTDWFGLRQPVQTSDKPDLVAMKEREAQADVEGMFHAFTAGYSPFGFVKPLYLKIYETYKLPLQMQQYYSRDQRIALAEAEAAEAQKLAHMYTLGIFFFARQEYAYAQRCWQYIAPKIYFKELLNNIGLSQLLQAVQLLEPEEAPFRYPFELSTYNRLDPKEVRGSAQITTILKESVKNFSKAIELDPTYQLAYINLSSAYSLLNNPEKAIEKIDELYEVLQPLHKPLPANAYLIRAIGYVQNREPAMAKKDFEKAQRAYEYTYNFQLFQQHNTFFATSSNKQLFRTWQRKFPSLSESTQIPEKQLGLVGLPLPENVILQTIANLPMPNVMRIKHTRTAENDVFRVQLSDKQVEMIRNLPSTKAFTTKGLTIGDPVRKIEDLYGVPSRIIPTGFGDSIYCYMEAHLLVEVKEKRVRNWMIFTEKQ